MKLPRDLSGEALARSLHRHFGYRLTRQRGGHMTLTATLEGESHSVTVPRHRHLSVGTLSAIISAVAEAADESRGAVRKKLFGG
ncbi:MAG: type II toxin-antitoxin system HicA family toxin [Gemmatimonadales bacterium]|nr:type II toxin-antitoxin system HicA family toxin [Candidatus Palauibacter denitrificans]